MTGEDIPYEDLAEERMYDVSECEDEKLSATSIAASMPGGMMTSSAVNWSSYTAPSTSPSTQLFDLAAMGIVQMGGFDSAGFGTNWIVTANNLPPEYPSFMHNESVVRLGTYPDYGVYIRGIYSRSLTNQRRAAMGLPEV